MADEWGVLRGRLWMRTFASVAAIRQAELVAEQIRGVREAITAQLGH